MGLIKTSKTSIYEGFQKSSKILVDWIFIPTRFQHPIHRRQAVKSVDTLHLHNLPTPPNKCFSYQVYSDTTHFILYHPQLVLIHTIFEYEKICIQLNKPKMSKKLVRSITHYYNLLYT